MSPSATRRAKRPTSRPGKTTKASAKATRKSRSRPTAKSSRKTRAKATKGKAKRSAKTARKRGAPVRKASAKRTKVAASPSKTATKRSVKSRTVKRAAATPTPAADRARSAPQVQVPEQPGVARLVQFKEVRAPVKPLKIALFGASGNLGRRITKEALERGHHVTAAVRDPTKLSLDHPHLGRVKADATDPVLVSVIAKQHDVLASAVSPPWTDVGELSVMNRSIVRGARDAGLNRVLFVGGSGGLEVKPGLRLLDSKGFPKEWRPIAQAHVDALETVRSEGEGLDWTVISPSAVVEPGKRTGKYRVGTEWLLTDGKGESRISMEDYAVAFVDEIERGNYKGKRVTVGY